MPRLILVFALAAALDAAQASLSQWEVVRGSAVSDSAVTRAHRSSLRVEAPASSDACIRLAAIPLTIGKRYEVSGWVRTENLQVRDLDRTPIAIGAALLLGMVSPENFHAPFAASNPTEFWRRWHITLTTWLTDYVFTPLRMATRDWGNAGLVLSLSINMTLIGAWHGFRWGYVLFGLVHALYLSVDALTQRARKRYYKAHPGMNRLTDWLGPVVVFHLAAAAFVVFRAQTTHDAFYVLTHPANGLAAPSLEFLKMSQANVVALIAGLVGYALIEAADWARRRNQQNSPAVAWPRWGRWSLYSCTVVTVAVMILLLMGGHASQNPFIYEIF